MKQQGNPQQGGQWAEQAKEGLQNQEKRQQHQGGSQGGQQGGGSDLGDEQRESTPEHSRPGD